MPEKKQMLTYKGLPLVRCGNIIIYGNASDKYVVVFTIAETKKSGASEIASKVIIRLQRTDDNLNFVERIVKSAEKSSLYDALDVGEAWLEIALNEK